MNETMDLNLIRAFIAVAEMRNFTRAAERLGIPRATISRRVALMEREIGVRLFQRTTRTVSLSTAGAALYDRVALPLASIDDALHGLPEVEERPAGKLRITAPVDLATALLPSILSQFLRDHPEVSAEVSVSNAYVDLVAGGFDCALRISSGKLRDSSLVGRRVCELPVQLCASPAYLERNKRIRRVTDLARHAWVVVTVQSQLVLSSGERTHRVDMRGRLETDDMLFAREAVLQGDGLGALPHFLIREDIARGRLAVVLPRWRAGSAHLWILWPGGRHVPRKTHAFCEAVSSTMS